MTTIFYSWQSDSPSRVNRRFIREALACAIENMSTEFSLEDAPRLDHDTKGLAGSPDVANSILNKIDLCSIFVPDLTLINKAPNPNVLLEYGYALKSKGSERITAVMNEAFGLPENLPFDLKYRRWPIRYTLPKDASSDVRDKQMRQLVADFQNAFTAANKVGLFQNPVQSEKGKKSVWSRSSFLSDGESIGEFSLPHARDQAKPILWFNAPQMYLRIIPTLSLQGSSPYKIRELIKVAGMTTMTGSADWIVINKQGSAIASGHLVGETLRANSVTEVFTSGEIWAIDQLDDEEQTDKIIPIKYVERFFTSTLQTYLRFFVDVLKLKHPFQVILGISGIVGFHLIFERNKIKGENCIQNDVMIQYNLHAGDDTKIDSILIPFFTSVWESCGLSRPNQT